MSELPRIVESLDRELKIWQGDDGPSGSTVWDAALVLAKYFERIEIFPMGYFRGKKVIELGSGTGFLGIVLALLGAHVTITDKEEAMLNLARKNVTENALSLSPCNSIGSHWKVSVRELSWEDPLPSDIAQVSWDFVVYSDCVFVPSLFEALASTLDSLTGSRSDAIVISSHELRKREELEFYKIVSEKGFSRQRVSSSDLDPVWQSDDIAVWKFWKEN